MKRKLMAALVIVCAAVLAVSAWQLIRYFYAGQQAEQGFDELRPPAEEETEDGYKPLTWADLLPYYRELKAQNGDFAGWLKIPGTNVDYPVMQTADDPEYYLHRDFAKAYSAQGTLFASEISDIAKPSDAVIIYGHKMQTGAMFGNLEKFLDQEYFDAHSEALFDTLGERREYRVFCVFRTQVYTESAGEFAYYSVSDFASRIAFKAFMGEVDAKTAVSNPDAAPVFGDKILMLSTCEYTRTNGRLVLLAVQVPAGR